MPLRFSEKPTILRALFDAYLFDQGMSFFVIGLLLACRDLTVNLLEIPSGALADSFGRRGAMVTSFVAYIISFLLLASAESTAAFFMGCFCTAWATRFAPEPTRP